MSENGALTDRFKSLPVPVQRVTVFLAEFAVLVLALGATGLYAGGQIFVTQEQHATSMQTLANTIEGAVDAAVDRELLQRERDIVSRLEELDVEIEHAKADDLPMLNAKRKKFDRRLDSVQQERARRARSAMFAE